MVQKTKYICFRIHKSFIIPGKIIDLLCFLLLACNQILSNNLCSVDGYLMYLMYLIYPPPPSHRYMTEILSIRRKTIFNQYFVLKIKMCIFHLCQDRAQWTQWSGWSHCSVTCGPGIKTATRTCQGSGSCNGSSRRLTFCNQPHHCPGIQ